MARMLAAGTGAIPKTPIPGNDVVSRCGLVCEKECGVAATDDGGVDKSCGGFWALQHQYGSQCVCNARHHDDGGIASWNACQQCGVGAHIYAVSFPLVVAWCGSGAVYAQELTATRAYINAV